MIYFISGPSHTGKTLLAQRILEREHIPYLSLDHLKMGLIRSGMTDLTVFDDDKMTTLLWPIVREIVKTAIENSQNLTVEGCYIPYTWREDFSEEYRRHIQAYWLIMTENYIETHFADIQSHANDVEQRLDDSGLKKEWLIQENKSALEQCKLHGCAYTLIDKEYHANI